MSSGGPSPAVAHWIVTPLLRMRRRVKVTRSVMARPLFGAVMMPEP
jgi:hypothetical protein